MDVTNIIVVGAAGRMGKMITSLAEEDSEFHLTGLVDSAQSGLNGANCPVSDNLDTILQDAPRSVVIDFTAPQVSMETARLCAKNGFPLVIGTTGFTAPQKEELADLAKKTPILWSANMSIGVNVLLTLLPRLAKALGPDYDMEMVEIHHGRKKDAPSGTALMLGEALANARGWQLDEVEECSREGLIGERPKEQIGIQAVRGGDVVGVHTVYFLGPGEVVEVQHRAESRENFARGALRAARWLADQPAGKLYSIQDMISGS